MVSEVPINDIFTLVLGTSALLVMTLAIIGFAFVFQRKLIRKERAYREIEKLLQSQEIKSVYQIIEGQDQERKRIASEIHDNIGNLLATLKIYSDLVIGKEQYEESARLNTKINDIIETVTIEIRKISHSLDAGTLQNFGLEAAVLQLVDAIHNSGKIVFTVHYDIQALLTGDTSFHIYRIIQELITNTLKHAQASKASLEISQVNGEISIIYEDNGVGFDSKINQMNGLGLRSIHSRIGHLRGELKTESSSSGSTFIIELPYHGVEHA